MRAEARWNKYKRGEEQKANQNQTCISRKIEEKGKEKKEAVNNFKVKKPNKN